MIQIITGPDQGGDLRHQRVGGNVLIDHDRAGDGGQRPAERALAAARWAGHHVDDASGNRGVTHTADCALPGAGGCPGPESGDLDRRA